MDNNKADLFDVFGDTKFDEYFPEFKELNKNEYVLISETKNLFNNIINEFNGLHSTEYISYLAAALVNLSKFFQSAVVLFERGLSEAGNVIIRSCIELSIKIVELINNPNFVNDMKKELHKETNRTLDIIQKKELYGFIPENTLKTLMSSLKPEECKHKCSIQSLATNNNLLPLYVLYRSYCNDSHQSIASLSKSQTFTDDYVIIDCNLKLSEFSNSICVLISIVIIPIQKLIDKHFPDSRLKNQYISFEENFTCFMKKFEQE